MKTIILIAVNLITLTATAQVKTYIYTSKSAGCPNTLKISEMFELNILSKIMIDVANVTAGRYEGERFVCQNLQGIPFRLNNGNELSCAATTAPSGGYKLEIKYNEPPRDPSDYGLQRSYAIQKTSKGIIAYWGQVRFDGKPIYCEYQ